MSNAKVDILDAAVARDRRLYGYAIALIRRHRDLENISLIYRDQVRIYPIQLEAMLKKLTDMRRVVLGAQAYLRQFDPQKAAQLRPSVCIEKLANLDTLLTEIILLVAMHAEICTAVTYERVRLHLNIRHRLPLVLADYDESITMLNTLATAGEIESMHVENQKRG